MTQENNELTDEQRMLIYKLGDSVSCDHIEEKALGDTAVIVSGVSWHSWEKKDAKGNVVESGEKPKFSVQFPKLPKLFEYRIPAGTLQHLEQKLGNLLDSSNLVGAKVQFLPKKTSFEWVDCIVVGKPENSAVSAEEADAVVAELEAEARKGTKK